MLGIGLVRLEESYLGLNRRFAVLMVWEDHELKIQRQMAREGGLPENCSLLYQFGKKTTQ